MNDVFHGRYFAPRVASRGPGTSAFVAAVVLHMLPLGLFIGNVFEAAEPLPEYKVYRVDIYSPPPQALGEPEAPAKPAPAIVKPPETKTIAVEKPAPKPAPVKAPAKNVTTGTGKSEVAKGRN